MGKPGAVRKIEFRERMSEDRKRIEREKNKEQQRKCRSNWSSAQKVIEAAKSKERMKKYRLKKKQSTSGNSIESPSKLFPSPQALGKAVLRVKKVLPSSPRKKKAVIIKISREMRIIPNIIKKKSEAMQSSTEWDKVAEFYSSDVVSRMMPGRKDFVPIKTENGLKRFQKRILVMTVMEAYQMFKIEYPSVKIGKSKFASLRPPYVLPVSDKDHTVCCCKYHENFELLIQGLKKFQPDLPTPNEIIECGVCKWGPECCLGNCKNCVNVEDYVESLFIDITQDDNEPGEYLQWNRMNKKERLSTFFYDMKEELIRQLKIMIKHSFTAKVQLHQIKYLKGRLEDGEAILHVDFAENFAIKHQNEVMSAHWVSEGVTLYTAVINDNKKVTSYAIVSDDLHHDKCAAISYNKTIISKYTTKCSLSTLHIFSDGAGSQFKNRYMLSSLLEPEKIHPGLISVDWSFFGTAHGKGPVDGIGGTVKRAVWRRILQEKVVVNTAKEFADVATEACPNINIIYVPSAVTSAERVRMQNIWNTRRPNLIPNTHMVHYVAPKFDNVLSVSKLSPFLEDMKAHTIDIVVYNTTPEPPPSEPAPTTQFNNTQLILSDPGSLNTVQCTIIFSKNEFVVVDYDGQRYPGRIEEVDTTNESVLVDVMHACLGGWKWPIPRDQIWYSKEKVIKKIDLPNPVNDRGIFSFFDSI